MIVNKTKNIRRQTPRQERLIHLEEKMLTVPQLLRKEQVKNRFVEILGNSAPGFISSLLTIYNENELLRKCAPLSVLTAASQAAGFKLPINPQLGYAYVLPYYDKRVGGYVAQFQLGYRGLIQLAMRSGKIRTLNTTEIYEGEIKYHNRLTGEFELGEPTSHKVIGYAAYMELTNGFKKLEYMSREEVERHAQNFSESYRKDTDKKWSVWAKNFDTMAKKTVMKKLLGMYAPTSVETNNLATAITADNSADNVIDEPTTTFEPIDVETGEVLNPSTDNSEETIIQ